MSCEIEDAADGRYVVLSFAREELLYDIKNVSYIEGSVMEPETPDHNRHYVQDVGEAGNVDRVTRILDLTVAKCREMLYPYTKRDVEREVYDDRFRERRLYGIVMKIPEGFSQTTLSYLEQLVHELLVCTAVREWLRITYPAKSQSWGERSEEISREIRVSLNSRASKVRIRPHWM